MVALFASGRLRVEMVALLGLCAAFLLGLVPEAAVFSGFSSPTVMTVLEILLIIGVLNRSHVMEAIGRAWPLPSGPRVAIGGLLVLSAGISVFMNNIGALALVIPLVFAVGARHGLSPRSLLMPVSFATLLGGLGSIIGTPANLLVGQAIEQLRVEPFGFFEIGLIGLPLMLVGIIYLTLTAPHAAADRDTPEVAAAPRRERVLKRIVPHSSPLIGQDTTALARRNIRLLDVRPVGRRRLGRGGFREGDLVFVGGGVAALAELDASGLVAPLPFLGEATALVEVVVMPESIFVGSKIDDLEPLYARDIAVDGLQSGSHDIEGPFDEQRLRIGDVLILRGAPEALAAELDECGLLPLAPVPDRSMGPATFLPVLLFAAGVALTALLGLNPEIAFGLVVIAMALTGSLSLRRGLETMNWPILIMLGAMIPIGAAVESTGLAGSLVDAVTGLIPVANLPALIAAMVLLATLLTPFVNNPATVLMLAPIAIETARQYGVPAEPLLLAVGVGASLDFLTPFGHHNNTLVMGLGGSSFGDFLRLGGPLVLLTGAATVILLSLRFG